jgi:NaMN:DMB phosphoribosyltransferase
MADHEQGSNVQQLSVVETARRSSQEQASVKQIENLGAEPKPNLEMTRHERSLAFWREKVAEGYELRRAEQQQNQSEQHRYQHNRRQRP